MTHPTLPATEHRHAGGSAGGPGENSAECTCGTTFAGFDTHREAVELLTRHVEQENSREKKRADQLAPGDIAVDILDGFDPWISHRDGKVLASYPYVDEVDNARVLLVVEGDGPKPKPETVRLDAEVMVGLRSEAELAAMRELAERAQQIADLRAFAEFLERNPWAPIEPLNMQWSPGVGLGVWNSGAEGVAQIREFAERMGVEVRQMDDRTEAVRHFGEVEYRLIAWHRDGRPVEPQPPADDLGFGYSRVDDDPQVIRPHSPRLPLHTGAVVDGGQLVDETPADDEPAPPVLTAAGLTPEADASRGPLAGTTPVVTYFTRGDGYVTVVAPTYDACREAMFAKYGDRWGLSYVAGMQRSTDAVRGYPEREVIVAPNLDEDLAKAALKAAGDLLYGAPVSEAR